LADPLPWWETGRADLTIAGKKGPAGLLRHEPDLHAPVDRVIVFRIPLRLQLALAVPLDCQPFLSLSRSK
jgi:hypothetical protein